MKKSILKTEVYSPLSIKSIYIVIVHIVTQPQKKPQIPLCLPIVCSFVPNVSCSLRRFFSNKIEIL